MSLRVKILDRGEMWEAMKPNSRKTRNWHPGLWNASFLVKLAVNQKLSFKNEYSTYDQIDIEHVLKANNIKLDDHPLLSKKQKQLMKKYGTLVEFVESIELAVGGRSITVSEGVKAIANYSKAWLEAK